MIILLWLANKNIKFINWFTGYANHTIRLVLNSAGISKEDIAKRARKIAQKSVDMFSLDGTYIRTFCSITEASNCFENKISMINHITDVCKGRRGTAGGYKWSYSLSFD